MSRLSDFFRLLLCMVTLLTAANASGQCNDWEKLLYHQNTSINDVARDRFGNTYVVGSFYANNLTLGSYTLPLAPGGLGAFIAKFDANYSVVWATSPVSTNIAIAEEVEVDAAGDVIVAGEYVWSLKFGCVTLPGSGRADVFVAKYTRDGFPLWAITSSGDDDESADGLVISPNGNILLISIFVEKSDVTSWLTAPDVYMGGVPVITGSNDQINGGMDSFIASIKPDGTVAWTQGIGGDGNEYDYAQDIAVDTHNNVIVTGFFSSPTIHFDQHTVHRHALSENFFLAKLDPNGETLWVRETEAEINQGGYGVKTDQDDNIFAVGRFYDDTKFGTINVHHEGEGDVFVVKFNPSGTPLNARGIGGTEFDSGTQVEVDNQGRVLVGAYYYSYNLTIGPYTSTKTTFPAHSFIATLSNDLSTVHCASFVTGNDESIIWDFEIDPAGNALAIVQRWMGLGTSVFGALAVSDPQVSTVFAMIGDNPAPDVGQSPPFTFTVSLGPDVTICNNETVPLSVGKMCGATYLWNTGSTADHITATETGLYWVEVTWAGKTVRDEIEIFEHEPIHVDLGADRFLCAGNAITWTLPHYDGVTYEWNDGSNATSNTVTQPGTYWVKLSNTCTTGGDTVNISAAIMPLVDLGNSKTLCSGNNLVLEYNAAPGETFEWSDGSSSPTLMVTEPGVYGIEVINTCGVSSDDVTVISKSAPLVELGGDQELCAGKDVILIYTPAADDIIKWSDGNSESTRPIHSPGTYTLTVTNACGEANDAVNVTVKGAGDLLIPNVVTNNGDTKNEHFILPPEVEEVSLLICNRWGEQVFYTNIYQNNWPKDDVTPGVYFYTVNGTCLTGKGTIHLIK